MFLNEISFFCVIQNSLARFAKARGMEFSAFVIDHKIYRPVPDNVNVIQLQEAMDRLQEEVLHLRTKGHYRHQYSVNNSSLSATEEVKNLEFLIANNLNFNRHYTMISNKTMRVMFNLPEFVN